MGVSGSQASLDRIPATVAAAFEPRIDLIAAGLGKGATSKYLGFQPGCLCVADWESEGLW